MALGWLRYPGSVEQLGGNLTFNGGGRLACGALFSFPWRAGGRGVSWQTTPRHRPPAAGSLLVVVGTGLNSASTSSGSTRMMRRPIR